VILLAIDPGIRHCGCALYSDGVLVAAALVKNPVERGSQAHACAAMAHAVWEWVRGVLGLPAASPVPAVWRWLRATFPTATAWLEAVLGVDVQRVELPDVVAVEWPRIYLGPKQKGDQNDLLALAGVDCAVVALFPGALLANYYPDEWKQGPVRKDVMCDRVWRRLSPEEQSRVVRLPKGGLDDNAIDACGIGLHHLGRLERRRAYG
jgi:hypothetical protein